MRRMAFAAAACAALVVCSSGLLFAQERIPFQDVKDQVGLGRYLERWTYGHGAAWGDADGDGRADLYIGAFADREKPYKQPDPPIPNQLFLNKPGGFVLSDDPTIQLQGLHARTTGVIFADLDNDGDLDLVLSNHVNGKNAPGSMAFENLGGGRWRDVTPNEGYWPSRLGTRNVACVDMNADGLLDLVFTDGTYASRGGKGKSPAKILILQNKGKWTFELVTEQYGLPEGETVGCGLAIGDVNDDGMEDFFVADCNRLFVSGPGRKYQEAQAGTFVLPPKGETMACGAAFGDLNGDGLLDLVTTEHGQPSRIHVYMNRGVKDGKPNFEHVSAQVGLGMHVPGTGKTGLAVKGAHVAILDMDNDGLRDIVTCMIWDDGGKMQPVVLKNTGKRGGMPQFQMPPLDSLVGYYAPGPIADYDRDGRLDIFLPTWGQFRRNTDASSLDIPSYLFRNLSTGGHWLTVKVVGKGKGLNPMGVGAIVRAYKSGTAGNKAGLLDRHDIVVGSGYSSGEEALAPLGLGQATTCDVEITWGGRKKLVPAVQADRYLTVTFE